MQTLISLIRSSGRRLTSPKKHFRRPLRRVELVGKKKFIAAVLEPESEIFVEHVTLFSSDTLPNSFPLRLNAHPTHKPQSLQL